jgi:carboxymethylenebutenolidase
MYPFGALDKSLPPEAIQLIRAADPKGVYHVYEGADHAFTNSDRPNFSSGAAALAHARTLDFLEA